MEWPWRLLAWTQPVSCCCDAELHFLCCRMSTLKNGQLSGQSCCGCCLRALVWLTCSAGSWLPLMTTSSALTFPGEYMAALLLTAYSSCGTCTALFTGLLQGKANCKATLLGSARLLRHSPTSTLNSVCERQRPKLQHSSASLHHLCSAAVEGKGVLQLRQLKGLHQGPCPDQSEVNML